jgi:hypothetical protein
LLRFNDRLQIGEYQKAKESYSIKKRREKLPLPRFYDMTIIIEIKISTQ